MNVWKLQSLSAAGFRGFNKEVKIELDSGLNIIYGPNGFGKTSIAEAVEWVLFGEISRETYARGKQEIKGCVQNVHSTHKTFVEIVVVEDDGDSKLIRREMLAGKQQLTIDGASADLSELGLQVENVPNPILSQHALKEFLNTEPANRWKFLSKFLGLGDVEAWRDRVKSVISGFLADHERGLAFLAELEPALRSCGWKRLADSMRDADLDELGTSIALANEAIFGMIAPSNSDVETKLNEMSAAIRQMPSVINEAAASATTVGGQLNADIGSIAAISNCLGEMWPRLRSQLAGASALEEVRFLREGLSLDPNPPACPFCGAETLTEQRLGLIRGIVAGNEALLTTEREYRIQMSELEDLVTRTNSSLVKAATTFDGLDFAQLADCVRDTEIYEPVLSFICGIEEASALFRNTSGTLSTLKNMIHSLVPKDATPQVWRTLSEAIGLLALCKKSSETLLQRAPNLESALAPVVALASQRSAEMRKMSALASLNANLQMIKTSLHVRALQHEMEAVVGEVDAYILLETEKRLVQQQEDTLDWYNLLNPSEDISFASMSAAKVGRSRQIALRGVTYGKEANAVALLSESHLNALALSLHLARAASSSAKLGFIVLDDPVQSMDAGHSLAVASELMNKLLGKGFQVLALTHLEQFREQCRTAHRLQHDHNVFDYELARYDFDGPVVEEKVEHLVDYLGRAKELANGSAESRKVSGHVLRKAIERFCKEVYIKNTDEPLPKRFQNQTMAELRPIAIKAGVDPDDITKIALILQQADPSSHDNTRDAPLKELLLKFGNQLDTLRKKYL